jgi:hypothetical protein
MSRGIPLASAALSVATPPERLDTTHPKHRAELMAGIQQLRETAPPFADYKLPQPALRSVCTWFRTLCMAVTQLDASLPQSCTNALRRMIAPRPHAPAPPPPAAPASRYVDEGGHPDDYVRELVQTALRDNQAGVARPARPHRAGASQLRLGRRLVALSRGCWPVHTSFMPSASIVAPLPSAVLSPIMSSLQSDCCCCLARLIPSLHTTACRHVDCRWPRGASTRYRG